MKSILILGISTLVLLQYVCCQDALNTTSFRQSRRSAMADSCTTNDGVSGTCMTRFNCMRQGGASKGFCGTYGVCCETNLQCNQVSKLKRTIIKNPAPLTEDVCQYTIQAFSPNVCQLLIEFQKFELEQPVSNPPDLKLECGDHFVVGKFMICGDNTNQHIYVPFSAAAGNEHVSLTFNLPNRWSQSAWRLVVTQLECPVVKRSASKLMPFLNQNNIQDLRTIFSTHHSDLDLLAPPGCDQYYTQSTGTIKSFNYKDGVNSFYMSELSYVICIKQSPGATMIEYTVRKFSLSSPADPVDVPRPFDEVCHSTIYTAERRDDYLMIPQSLLADNSYITPTYYCGSLPEKQVIYASPPFMMYFSSDDKTDETETGFSFDYRIKSVI